MSFLLPRYVFDIEKIEKKYKPSFQKTDIFYGNCYGRVLNGKTTFSHWLSSILLETGLAPSFF